MNRDKKLHFGIGLAIVTSTWMLLLLLAPTFMPVTAVFVGLALNYCVAWVKELRDEHRSDLGKPAHASIFDAEATVSGGCLAAAVILASLMFVAS